MSNKYVVWVEVEYSDAITVEAENEEQAETKAIERMREILGNKYLDFDITTEVSKIKN